jgi:hypothetical protein
MTQHDDRNIVRVFENLETRVGREEISRAVAIIGEGYPTILSEQTDVLLKLYAAFLEEQTFEVAYGGAVALPKSSFSGSNQIRREMSEQHKAEYCKSVEQGLRAYVSLIEKNKAANRLYQIPKFTIEKAEEIAQEAFEESFRKARSSYKIERE